MNKRLRARIAGALAAAALTAGLIVAPSAPASAAEQRCNYDGVTFNACLTIEYQGSGWWSVHIGFDRYWPKWYVDSIIGSSSIFADLWGEDGSTDHRLAYIPLQSGPASGTNPEGLFASFYSPYERLDEDAGSDRDEVYGAVTFYAASPTVGGPTTPALFTATSTSDEDGDGAACRFAPSFLEP